MDNYTTYPSGLLVVDPNGLYSKHYYMGTQRIASRIGDGTASIFEGKSSGLHDLKSRQQKDMIYYFGKEGVNKIEFSKYEKPDLKLIANDGPGGIEPPKISIYFYHPDHLGTNTVITNMSGNIYQYFLNLPFGETMAEQHGNEYFQSPWKFNGKELDVESGLYYYGARYYDPRTSVWLSVDKMSDKMPNWTPYRYGLDNPLRFTDIDGFIEWPVSGTRAVNKRDVPNGGFGLANTIVRTSTYMDRDRPVGATNPHIGIDYRASTGTSFYSLGDGKVVAIGSSKRGGNFITVEYGNGDKVTFRHIKSVSDGIEVGTTVFEGQILGQTGNSGTKTPHLHIEVRDKYGVLVNPESRNYGTVTNEEFFTTYEGDYQKLKSAKAATSNEEQTPQTYTAVPDATWVSNPFVVIGQWLEKKFKPKEQQK
jgi:RHS repeat-associated protein